MPIPTDIHPEPSPVEETKQIKVPKALHSRLKILAAERETPLQALVEDGLWPVVGGKPQPTEPATV